MRAEADETVARMWFNRGLFVFLLGYVFFLSYRAYYWPSLEDKVFPLLINALLVLTLLIVLVRWQFFDTDSEDFDDIEEDETRTRQTGNDRREKLILALSVAAVVFIYLFGFDLGLFLFVFITVYTLTRDRRLAAMTATGFIVFLFGSFFVFEVRTWNGVVRVWLESLVYLP